MRLLAQIFKKEDFPNIPPGPSSGDGLPIAGVMQFIFAIIGVISVVMIMVGGFKYILSQGNPQETAKAKDTILYAIIGLVLSATAFSIVSFFVGTIG